MILDTRLAALRDACVEGRLVVERELSRKGRRGERRASADGTAVSGPEGRGVRSISARGSRHSGVSLRIGGGIGTIDWRFEAPDRLDT